MHRFERLGHVEIGGQAASTLFQRHLVGLAVLDQIRLRDGELRLVGAEVDVVGGQLGGEGHHGVTKALLRCLDAGVVGGHVLADGAEEVRLPACLELGRVGGGKRPAGRVGGGKRPAGRVGGGKPVAGAVAGRAAHHGDRRQRAAAGGEAIGARLFNVRERGAQIEIRLQRALFERSEYRIVEYGPPLREGCFINRAENFASGEGRTPVVSARNLCLDGLTVCQWDDGRDAQQHASDSSCAAIVNVLLRWCAFAHGCPDLIGRQIQWLEPQDL